MKIPESVRINGVDYKLVFKPGLNDGASLAYGFIDYEKSIIELNPDRQEHQRMCQTLWHEICHGILFSMGLSMALGKREEEIVDAFSRGIYQVLQDNASSMFDLASPTTQADQKQEVSQE